MKQSATDAIKTTFKRVIQKIAEETGDFIVNKNGGKITCPISQSNQEISLQKEE